MARAAWLPALLLSAVVLLAGACSGDDPGGGPPAGSGEGSSGSTGERATAEGTEALVWGEGEFGVVLAHGAAYDAASWEPLAREISREGMTALAVEDISEGGVLDGVRYLREERGAGGVALIGASAGSAGVLGAAEEAGPDGLILLSGTGEVSGLGDYPKLFVASEGEGISSRVREMAQSAPGGDNEALILPGDAHAQAIFRGAEGERLTRAILERLKAYRG